MSYKNVQHYRYTVHKYLDAIWMASSKKHNARTALYKTLSIKMNIPIDDTHVSKFTRDQCKEAIQILRPMYIQLFGSDLSYRRKEIDYMYYSNMRFKVAGIKFKSIKYYSIVDIIVYCKSNKLTNEGVVIDLDLLENSLREYLDKTYISTEQEITMENLAKNIYEQVIPCYKVTIRNDFDEVTYEEVKE